MRITVLTAQIVLVLDGCKQLSNYTLQYILQNCWKLETLSLRGCFLITDGPFITSCSLFYGLHALVSLRVEVAHSPHA